MTTLTNIAHALAADNPHFQFDVDAASIAVTVPETEQAALGLPKDPFPVRRILTLDLHSLPALSSAPVLVVSLRDFYILQVSNLEYGRRLALRVLSYDSLEPALSLHLRNIHGTLRLTQSRTVLLFAHEKMCLELDNCEVKVGIDFRVEFIVRATGHGPSMISGPVDQIYLSEGTLHIGDDTFIDSLIVGGEEPPTLRMMGSRIAIHHLSGDPSLDKAPGVEFLPAVLEPRTSEGEGPEIIVHYAHRVDILGKCQLKVGVAKDITFSDPETGVHVIISAENISFGSQILSFENDHVVVAGAQGTVMVGDLCGGSLLGHPEHGLHVMLGDSSDPDWTPLLEAQLEQVSFDSGLAGLRAMSHLAAARRVEPDTSNPPGWEFRLRGSTGQVVTDPSARLRLSYDADVMRRYTEIIRDKGASGAASTKIGWCAQRLRHLVTTGRWERTVLSAYRLLGYGERPGPALATWLVAALVLTVILNFDRSLQLNFTGLGNLITAWLANAFSPLGALLKTGTSRDDETWVYIARAVVAVPLVVAVFAFRRYLRAS